MSPPPGLQVRLQQIAEALRGRLGCLVCDADGRVWAEHRADELFITASVIKVPILLALAAEVDAGKFAWTEVVPPEREDAAGSGVLQHLSPLPYTLRDLATLMIIVSDNRATNRIIDLVGMERITGYCAAAGWRKTVLARRMMDFAARNLGRENYSTPREMADLFVRLLQGKLLASGTTTLVLEILSAQQLDDRLPAWMPQEMRIAHKTGGLPDVQNDSGILYFPSGPVIASVFTNDLAAQAEGRLAIQEIGRAIADAVG
jgi:beta-lactamase class A